MPPSQPPEPASPAASPPAPTATEALYRAALAEGDIAFYLPVFAGFDERGVSRPHWNPAAALFNLNWLLYRRLWRAAACHALVFGALGLLLWWWGPALGALAPLLWLGLIAVAIAVPGFWGNAWLHHDVRRRMTAAVRRARTVQEACEALQQQERRRPVLAGAVALQAVLVASMGIDGSWPAVSSTTADAPPVAMSPPPAAPASNTTGLVEPLPAPAPASAPAAADASADTPTGTAAGSAPAVEPPAAPAEMALRPRLRGFGVNVGMFADPANADRARQRLVDAGLPVLLDPVESARGTLTRVRVGPFDDEAAAARAADTVRAVGLEARVFGP